MPFLPPPPSRLFLMRHAQAGWAKPGQTDFDRTLDQVGREEAAAVSRLAADSGFRPDLILCSTAARCRETADAFLAAFAAPPEILFCGELYNAPPAAYFEQVSRHSGCESLLLIGHNPAMEEILETLSGMRATADVVPDGYPTAGFAVLTHVGEIADEAWALTAFLRR